MVRPTLTLAVTPRDLPFVLIGGGVSVLPVWGDAPTLVVAAVAFLVVFDVRPRLTWGRRS